MEKTFKPDYKHIILADPAEDISKYRLDESPVVPKSILNIIDEFIYRHVFVQCPFKATQAQKDEYADNKDRLKELYAVFKNSYYIGKFALDRFGFVIMFDVNCEAEYNYDLVNTTFLRKI